MKNELRTIANKLGGILQDYDENLPEDVKGIICVILDELNEIIDKNPKK